MGDLKPIGSEKLQGEAKLKRIMEIARYNEVERTTSNVNETVDYTRQLADGKYYSIIHEKNGYIIKAGLNESEMDYVERTENRRYHTSYSKALKKLNLLAKELNTLHENEEGLELFGEQEKKFVLKTPKPEVEEPAVEPEMDLDLDLGSDMGSEDGGEELDLDMDLGMDDEGGEEEVDMDMELDSEAPADDEEVSIKTIQKLTGKLGQKLRTIDSQDGLSSEDIKYVLNSIISAVNLDNLTEEDKEDILANFEEDEVDYGVDDEAELDVDAGDELDLDMDLDMDMEEPMEESVDAEISEDYDDMLLSIGDMMSNRRDQMVDRETINLDDYDETEVNSLKDLRDMAPNGLWFDMDGDGIVDAEEIFNIYKEKYGQPKLHKRRPVDTSYDNLVGEIFGESKIDKVLSKYFVVSDEEKTLTESKNIKKFLVEKIQKVTIRKEMKSMCETVEQELTADFLLKENDSIKFLGKTNKGNLVFENEGQQIKVSQNGELL
jgi:hypothetical protein